MTLHPKFAEKQRTILDLMLKVKTDPNFKIPGGGHALFNPFDLALIQVDSTQLPQVKEYPQLFSGHDFFNLFNPAKRVDQILVYSHFNHLSKVKNGRYTIEKRMMSFRAPGDVIILEHQGRQWLHFFFANLPDQHICMGDSGSGAFIKNEVTNSKVTLVGVNSSGRSIEGNDSYMCMERSNFSPISAENTMWIESVIGQ